MGQITRLTEMQMKFAHEVVSNEGRKNGTECAVSAAAMLKTQQVSEQLNYRIQKGFH